MNDNTQRRLHDAMADQAGRVDPGRVAARISLDSLTERSSARRSRRTQLAAPILAAASAAAVLSGALLLPGGGHHGRRGAKGRHGGHSRQNSAHKAHVFGQDTDLDWRMLWNEGTDAVMDIPLGGVCEILYGSQGAGDDDVKGNAHDR